MTRPSIPEIVVFNVPTSLVIRLFSVPTSVPILVFKVVTSFPIRVSTPSIRVLIVFALVVIAVFKVSTSVVTRSLNVVTLVLVACNCLPVTASLDVESNVASCRPVSFVPFVPAKVIVSLVAES